jgi:pectinesterase
MSFPESTYRAIPGQVLRWSALWILAASTGIAAQQVTLVVDQNGRGDFRSIQEAIDAVPKDNRQQVVILIKRGTYREKLFITRSFLSLVGEDRDSTRIVHAELRSNWTKARDNRPDGQQGEADWGSGVINIGGNVSDILLGNLTVHNNYGSLYGNHDHQFAVRGFKATRISLLYCTVISDGGDTVSLWDSDNGLYYHAFCSFEGWVDFVCPRGWCYVTDSRFFGHNKPSASIWHDGSQNKRQKFVIRNSFFDGVEGFPLGRHHRDAQFYLVDCTFSRNMADRSLYSPKSPNTVPWIWGSRHYFYNCAREGGNYAWFSDNLETAEGSPNESEITAAWTFDGRWDPEKTLPSILPFAALPQPRNDAYDISEGKVVVRWIPGRNARSNKVLFGDTNPPRHVAETKTPQFIVEAHTPGTDYYWRIDTVTKEGTVPGHVWRFRTREREEQRGEQ